MLVSPRLGRDAVFILAMDDVADAVDAVDVRRGRVILLCSAVRRPAVAFEAVDATDPRRVSLSSDFAVLNVVEASLLFDAVETDLVSPRVDVVDTCRVLSFLVDSFEFGLIGTFEELAAAPPPLVLRIVEACERTEAATDLGLSGCAALLATLLVLDTVESEALDTRETRDA